MILVFVLLGYKALLMGWVMVDCIVYSDLVIYISIPIFGFHSDDWKLLWKLFPTSPPNRCSDVVVFTRAHSAPYSTDKDFQLSNCVSLSSAISLHDDLEGFQGITFMKWRFKEFSHLTTKWWPRGLPVILPHTTVTGWGHRIWSGVIRKGSLLGFPAKPQECEKKKRNKVAFYGWYPSTVAAHVTLIMINFSYGCIWLCKIHAGDIVLSHNVFPINLMTILEIEWYYLWRQNSSSGTTDVYVSTSTCGPSILIKTAPVWWGVKCVVLECKKYVQWNAYIWYTSCGMIALKIRFIYFRWPKLIYYAVMRPSLSNRICAINFLEVHVHFEQDLSFCTPIYHKISGRNVSAVTWW